MIGELTINEIGGAVTGALLDHMNELNEAYQATEDGAFPIAVTVKIRPCAEGNRIDVGVSFVTSRVKTSVVRIVNEKQMAMFEKGE